MLYCNSLHSEVHKQKIHAGLKHYFGHCYQLFSCLRIRPAEAKKEFHIPLAVFCNETVGEVELPLGV